MLFLDFLVLVIGVGVLLFLYFLVFFLFLNVFIVVWGFWGMCVIVDRIGICVLVVDVLFFVMDFLLEG